MIFGGKQVGLSLKETCIQVAARLFVGVFASLSLMCLPITQTRTDGTAEITRDSTGRLEMAGGWEMNSFGDTGESTARQTHGGLDDFQRFVSQLAELEGLGGFASPGKFESDEQRRISAFPVDGK